MRSWTTLTISWSTLLRSEQQGDEVQEGMHKRSFGKGIRLDLKINDLIQGIEVYFKCIKWVYCFQLQGPQSRPGFLTYQVSFTWVPTYLGQNWAEDGSDIPVLELIRLAL